MVNAFRDVFVPFIQSLKSAGYFTKWIEPPPSEFLTSGTELLQNKSNFDGEKFRQYVRRKPWTEYHGSGSCKMGPKSDSMAVVNQRGKVHGLKHLRVVDNSIMPVITSSNTQIPAYVIGERMADLIKEDLNI